MRVDIHHFIEFDHEVACRLDEISRKLDLILGQETELMTLKPEVQALVDQVTQNTNYEQASAQAMQSLVAQTAALNQQITDLEANQTIDPDDLAAIKKASADLADSAAKLQTAIPAGTTPTPAPAPQGRAGA